MKTIALVETNYGNGHHLTYLRLFTKVLLEQKCQVMAFYPKPSELTDWVQENCPEYRDRLCAFEMHKSQRRRLPLLGTVPQPVAVIERWQHTAREIRRASEMIGYSPDMVFFNWLDNYLSHYLTHHIIDYIFPYNWSGIYFRPGILRFGSRSLVKLDEPLAHYSIARSSRCRVLTMLNEDLVKMFQADLNKPVLAFPDITDETPPSADYPMVQQIKQKANGRKIIGLVGSLSKRKGILTLLEVARKSIQENWFFVLAGKLDKSMFHQEYDQRFSEEYESIQNLINAPPSNCYLHFDSISDESVFNSVINVCDILFAAYENFPYSSNLLTKAAVFEKPIIVSEGFCMGRRVEKFRLGVTVPEGDPDACVGALHSLCDKFPQRLHDLNPDFEGYKKLHSMERVHRVFEEVLACLEPAMLAAQ